MGMVNPSFLTQAQGFSGALTSETIISLDMQLYRVDEVGIPVTANPIHYGGGVFEGGVLMWNEKLQRYVFTSCDPRGWRLKSSAQKAAMAKSPAFPQMPVFPWNNRQIVDEVFRVVKANGWDGRTASRLYVRPVVLMSGTGLQVYNHGWGKLNLIIIVFPYESYGGGKPLAMNVSTDYMIPSHREAVVNGKVVGNYVIRNAAAAQAALVGCDDAILTSYIHGSRCRWPEDVAVKEATTAGLSVVINDVVYCHTQDGTFLPSITQQEVNEMLRRRSVKVVDGGIVPLMWIIKGRVQAAFVNGSARGIGPIEYFRIGRRKYKMDVNHPIVKLAAELREEYMLTGKRSLKMKYNR